MVPHLQENKLLDLSRIGLLQLKQLFGDIQTEKCKCMPGDVSANDSPITCKDVKK